MTQVGSKKGEIFIRVPGNGVTINEGIKVCKDLRMKLLELRSNSDVSDLLESVEKDNFETSASMYYDKKLRAYVYFSDGQAVKDNTVI